MIRAARRIWNRVLGSLTLRHREDDLAEELESHIQLLADEHIRRGVPPEEAYRRARLKFGNVETTKESYRDQRGLPFLDALSQDLRFASRAIRKNPGFATAAVLSLAVGIGANTAIFSVVDAVLLRPLPFKDPDRIFAAREASPQFHNGIPVNPLHAREWGKQCPSIEQIAVIGGARAQITAGGEPETLLAVRVPHNLFALFGVQPLLGRAFVPEEEQEGRDRVAILSETVWRARFNGDPALIGKTIVLNGQNYQVVGVVPGWFRLPYSAGMEARDLNVRFEVFFPLALAPTQFRPRGNHNYNAVVRLRPGASAERALAEMDVVLAQFPREDGRKDLRANLIPVHELVSGRARAGLWMLAGGVGAVLLIVCINLANMLLSRMASRRREAAIRTALGASRGRQFRSVLTESMLLAVSGGVLGVVFAGWLLRILLTATTIGIPRLEEIRLDSTVLAFSFCLTVITGLLFGALPAWRLAGVHPQDALRSGSRTATEGRGGMRVQQGLIGLEVGLSTALLVVAGLLTTSLTRLLEVDKGFDVHQVLMADIRLGSNLYREDATRERFLDRIVAKAAAIPGVQASGFVTALPTRGETWLDPIYLEGRTRPDERHPVNNRYASPGYFSAMNIRVRQGRAFEDSDRGRHVAVLSEKAARILWPGEPNPVGRRFVGEDDKPKELVGIVGDVRANLQREAPPTVYYPYWQRVPGNAYLVVRTAGDPGASAGAIRAALRGEDPELPIPALRTMEYVVGETVAQRRFQSTLVLVFAASALLVAALGIYGVVSYAVARRRNEIGIRMALGAQRLQVLGLVIRQGMAPVLVGLGAGIAVALLAGRAIRGLLFGVQPTDPLTIAGVIAVLVVIGALACFIPARRAAGANAIAALRSE